MKGKSVSGIIPSYNGARFLSEAIESVLAQTYREFEIIVVDDGSTDNSGEIARGYPGVRVISQENQGVAAARNTGLHESRGDFLVFLDADDRLLPNALEVGMNCLNAHPECGFVFGLARLIGADGAPWPDRLQWQIKMAPYPEHFHYEVLLSGRTLVPPCTAMFRRPVFESIGGFDTFLRRMQDYDIYLRIAQAFPIFCHNQVIVEYRQHRQNLSRDISGMLEATLRVYDTQRGFVTGNKDYEVVWVNGRNWWRRRWGRNIPYEAVRKIRAGQFLAAFRAVCVGLRCYPQGFFRFPLVLLLRLAKYCCSDKESELHEGGSD